VYAQWGCYILSVVHLQPEYLIHTVTVALSHSGKITGQIEKKDVSGKFLMYRSSSHEESGAQSLGFDL